MRSRKGLTRRSFVTRVTGGAMFTRGLTVGVIGGGLLGGGLIGDAFAFQTRGCSDRDPTDPSGNGRTCTPPGPVTGCSDSDPTDPSSRGRRCTPGTSTSCTDSDPTDPAGRGRNCRGGQPPQPPQPPTDTSYRGNTTYTGCSDSDSGTNYDRSSYGRNCTQRGVTGGGNTTQTGCTDSDSGQTFDRSGYGRNCTTQPQQQSTLQAWLDPDCNPMTLFQSRLPSTTCSLNIRGFRRNTDDPVEVVLPSAVDGFGNHANGVQITFSGQGRTYDWPDVYRWSLFIFGCPSLPGTGANCYNAGTRIFAPIPFSVPLIVRQRGAGETRVTLSGTMMPHPGANNPLSQGAGCFSFTNLFRREFVLNSNGMATWLVDPVLEQPGYVRLRSTADQTQAIHVEQGAIAVSPIANYWDSALWALETPRGPGLVRIRNKYRPDWYIHVERGAVEASPAPSNWDSSYWQMQALPCR